MKCPKCGADNPESAEYCSLCMEKLLSATATGAQRGPGAAAGDLYIAPGEWRGDADLLRPAVSKAVKTKVKRFRVRLIVYGVIAVAIAAWLVLSFTVWANPSPGERSMQLFEAINAGDSDAFVALFGENERSAAEDLYGDIASYLGPGGRYENIQLDVVAADAYDAASYVEGGSIAKGGGTAIAISASDNMMIKLENHAGRWFVVRLGTRLVP